MFVMVFNKALANKLESLGFKKMPTNANYTCFILDMNKKFNFEKEDISKYKFTNKLTF